MDKNTIWAIVLSSLVLFASFFIQSKFFSKPQPAENTEVQSQTLQNTANTPSAVNAVQGSDSSALQSGSDEGTFEGEDAETKDYGNCSERWTSVVNRNQNDDRRDVAYP